MKFLFLMLLSFSALADQVEPCHDCTEQQFFVFGDNLGWEAATRSQIRNAACTRDEPFSEQEMNNWLAENAGTQNKNETIAGISFEGESQENLTAFKRLVTAVNFYGHVDQTQPQFSSQCKKVKCAVDEIFGETGTQTLFMLRKFGFNGSHIAHHRDADAWKKSELDEVLLALSDFPSSVLPMQDNRKLIHFKRGYMRTGGEHTIANAVIEIFDVWNEENKEMRRYTIAHEVGHYIAGESDVDETDYWKSLSDWSSRTVIEDGERVTQYEAGRQRTLVSRYAKSNPSEDFAESVSAYRYNPSRLKDKSPEKYDLIKNVIFNGVEYTSNERCRNPKLSTDEIAEKAKELLAQWQPSDENYRAAAEQCFPNAVREFASHGKLATDSSQMSECYEKTLGSVAKKFMMQAIADHPYAEFMEPMLRNNSKIEIPNAKKNEYVAKVKSEFGSSFPAWIAKGISANDLMTPACKKDDMDYVYQDFEELANINNFTLRSELSSIAQSLCKNAVANRNTLNSLNIINVRGPEVRSAIARLVTSE